MASDWPFWVEVTGIVRVSVVGAVAAENWTVMMQVAAGASVMQFELVEKFWVDVVGVAMLNVEDPVFVRVTVWEVAVELGTELKVRAMGLKLKPGSGLP